MTHEERKRQERARARKQMGTLLGRKPQGLVGPGMVVVGVDWAKEGTDVTAYVCSCGEVARSVEEILMCKHEAKREA